MSSARLDHVNIQTTRLRETVRFYADVVELTAGDPPPPLDPNYVQWMFGASGDAIFHLTSPGSMDGLEDSHIGGDTGAVHHVALDCQGHDAMVAKLERLGLSRRLNHVKAI